MKLVTGLAPRSENTQTRTVSFMAVTQQRWWELKWGCNPLKYLAIWLGGFFYLGCSMKTLT